MIKYIPYLFGDLQREKGRYCVSNLNVLLSTAAVEEVVVRKSLKARCFPYREAPTLSRIRVNEVVAILGDMARDGG